jgi:hypothetical protein
VYLQPVFQLGMPGYDVSNVEGGGARKISRGSMNILGGAARLLPDAKGRVCWSFVVHSAEQYRVIILFEVAQDPPVLPDFELQVGRSEGKLACCNRLRLDTECNLCCAAGDVIWAGGCRPHTGMPVLAAEGKTLWQCNWCAATYHWQQHLWQYNRWQTGQHDRGAGASLCQTGIQWNCAKIS